MKEIWSKWRLFPDPRNGDCLIAPFGAGCYQLRLRDTKELILFGMGGHVALRMSSLLPTPLGCGTRNNIAKRNCVLEELGNVEYRTIPAATTQRAKEIERAFNKVAFRFAS